LHSGDGRSDGICNECSGAVALTNLEAARLTKEARALSRMDGLEAMAEVKIAKSKDLMDKSRELLAVARLEDTKVRQVDYWKETKKGRQNYPRWVVSWQEGDKIITKYLAPSKR